MTLYERGSSVQSGLCLTFLLPEFDSETLRRFSKIILPCIETSSIELRDGTSRILQTVWLALNHSAISSAHRSPNGWAHALFLARQRGKLPRDTVQQDYVMCYASGKCLEMHRSAIHPGDRAVIVDDVLASGGSALAAIRLVEQAGGICIGVACVADMLDGPFRRNIDQKGIPISALARL